MSEAGFQIFKAAFTGAQIAPLQQEADRLARDSGTSCVRNIRAKSPLFHQLAQQAELLDLLPPGMRPVRSILFDKTPAQNWPVAWHQDLTWHEVAT